ncbi:MAG: 4-hydroxythreonine-4-phosphate dehydrogenase PdxA [Betaproteobacteria bacterium]|jgi:4-hydroxythreonine-4-phosphate dehydrogenase|nr:4-hydroxythreonine-4-phosphate dehydrogenase PdxA [Betaproteobacteria bacterium]
MTAAHAPVAARKPLPLLVTMGDPAGIGPEIIARAWLEHPEALMGAVVVGDAAVMRRALSLVVGDDVSRPLAVGATLADAAQAAALPRCIALWQAIAPMTPPAFGRVDAQAGRAAAQCVVAAAQAALRGEARAIVTAPLNKEALAAAGYDHPGHTELLQSLAAAHQGVPVAQLPVRMMLANDELRTVLVSIHLSLRDALQAVTVEAVLQTLRITHESLSRMLGRAPRIAVAGLNPHAGEGGLFGREEIEVIAPAISLAQQQGIDAFGPLAPDTVFMRARATSAQAGGIDAVIAMYHDQGLIPVKYLGVEQGVNVTLGLPLVRTSPDHGTAFDIAGTGRADPRSLLQAVRMARALSAAHAADAIAS